MICLIFSIFFSFGDKIYSIKEINEQAILFNSNYLENEMNINTFEHNFELEKYIRDNQKFKDDMVNFYKDNKNSEEFQKMRNEGIVINIMYSNYKITNLINIDEKNIFCVIQLREISFSSNKELQKGID